MNPLCMLRGQWTRYVWYMDLTTEHCISFRSLVFLPVNRSWIPYHYLCDIRSIFQNSKVRVKYKYCESVCSILSASRHFKNCNLWYLNDLYIEHNNRKLLNCVVLLTVPGDSFPQTPLNFKFAVSHIQNSLCLFHSDGMIVKEREKQRAALHHAPQSWAWLILL